MRVELIPNKDTYDFLLNIHYAGRIPSISFAYGLFDNDELIGVITYGTPPSPTLRAGIAGKDNIQNVLELNRLVLKYNRKNEASFLIGRSMKLLPKPRIIISFADTAQGHEGTVYKATNFLYCGLSAKRTDWKIKGMEHLHGQTVADMSRGKENRVKFMRDTYGEDFYLQERSRKHRFIYIIGDRKQKKKLLSELKYKQQ